MSQKKMVSDPMKTETLHKIIKEIENANFVPVNGRVSQLIGLVIESTGPDSGIGDICQIKTGRTSEPLLAEVVGFKKNKVLLMPIGDIGKISPGCPVVSTGKSFTVKLGEKLKGRVIDGFGKPIDGKGEITFDEERSVYRKPPPVLKRKRILKPLSLGIRAIDGLLTIGKGQRVGIFAGSGVGKSTLLGIIARNTSADINVIALIGERGREVREFIEKDLGPEGLSRSILVVVTSDEPPLLRVKGAYIATTIAEYFREKGHDVNLMLDSITRFCMAKREIGLSIGEPPSTKGYPPSVFSELPKLLERAGMGEKGSITGLYTVLVEGDDMDEPVSDSVRSILDGHIILSRQLANLNHYPAIDVLGSVSRLMPDIITEEHKKISQEIKEIMASYQQSKDLIEVGAYTKGTNNKLDFAIEHIGQINAFLRQGSEEKETLDSSISRIAAILSEPGQKEGHDEE